MRDYSKNQKNVTQLLFPFSLFLSNFIVTFIIRSDYILKNSIRSDGQYLIHYVNRTHIFDYTLNENWESRPRVGCHMLILSMVTVLLLLSS